MTWEIFGKESKVGKRLGSAMLLKHNFLNIQFPISQISQFFLNDPNFRNFFEGTYTNHLLYINYFNYSSHPFPFFIFRFDVFFMGNLGNWEMRSQYINI